MKYTILFSTLVMIFVLVPIGSAQVSSMRVTFSESVSPYGGGQGM